MKGIILVLLLLTFFAFCSTKGIHRSTFSKKIGRIQRKIAFNGGLINFELKALAHYKKCHLKHNSPKTPLKLKKKYRIRYLNEVKLVQKLQRQTRRLNAQLSRYQKLRAEDKKNRRILKKGKRGYRLRNVKARKMRR
jgi:hypothetical protein